MKMFKKILATFLCVIMVFGSAPLAGFVGLDLPAFNLFAPKASAATYSGQYGDGLTWNLNTSTGVLQISGTGAMIKEAYSSFPWDSYRSAIKTVKISNGITSIGNAAFENYYNLTSITIPESVTSIGNFAFSGCTRLTGVTIPESVTSLSYCVFNSCTGLTSVTIPESVTVIGGCAFEGCTNLSSVAIPDSVTSIGDYAFSDCTSLTTITIPGSVTSIGDSIFTGCTGLTSIAVDINNPNYSSDEIGVLFNKNKTKLIQYPMGNTRTNYVIPDGIISIEDDAFRNCDKLAKITLPDSLTSIGNRAFIFCTNITDLAIPNSVTSIGNSAFYECDGLTSITIPDSVTNIGKETFYYCSNLESITFGKGVSANIESSISGCDNIVNIIVSPDNTAYSSEDGVLFNKNKTELLKYPKANPRTNYSIPTGVTIVSGFFDCSNLENVIIPDGVTKINGSAFYSCYSLKSIVIPSSVRSIGKSAFWSCSELTTTYYSGTQEQWKNISILGENYYLTGSSIVFEYLSESPYYGKGSCGENLTWFLGLDGELVISGTGDMVDWFDSSYVPWYSCTSEIESVVLPESVTIIGNYAFSNCNNLIGITIPDGVTRIGRAAFGGCSNLGYITIPDDVTSIDGYAFRNCDSLEKIYYAGTPEQWAAISVGENNDSLPNIIIFECNSERPYYQKGTCGENLEWILYADGELVINGTGGMTDWSSKTSTPWYKWISQIKSVSVDNGVTSIGKYAFDGCTDLTSITIPNGVTSVGDYSFADCASLSSVHILNDASGVQISEKAFYNSAATLHFCIVISDATCTEDGIGDWVCEECDIILVENIAVSALGHDWSAENGFCARENCEYECEHPADNLTWVTVFPPTCAPGIEFTSCDICGANGTPMVVCDAATYPESPHSYSNGTNRTWEFKYDGAAKLILKFSSSTKTENKYDYIYIYDAKGTQVGKYCGTQLSGAEIELKGSSFKIKLTSDSSTTAYGFKFDSITAVVPDIANNSLQREIPAIAEYDWSSRNGVCENDCGTECNHPSYTQNVCDVCGGTCDTCGHNYDPNLGVCKGCGHKCETMGHIFVSSDSGCSVCGVIGGTCGDNVYWIYDESTEELLISGTGVMATWSGSNAVPWKEYSSLIKTVEVSEGVTSIGNYAFYGCTNLTDVFYMGTGYGWDEISIGKNNSALENANIHFERTCVVWNIDGNKTVVEYNLGDLIVIPNTPVKDGYVFTGWTPNVPTTVDEQYLVFTATWQAKEYNVTWNVDGEISTDTYYFDDAITAPTPEKDGYFFIGWDKVVPDTMPAESLEFVAQWSKVEYEFEFDGNGIIITAVKDASGDIEIPAIINGYPVIAIDEYAFAGSDITSVTIFEGVESIGLFAFAYCDKLETVNIPSSVTEIDYGAFSGCSNIETINISADNNNFVTDEYGVVYTKGFIDLVYAPAKSVGRAYSMRSTATYIYPFAFSDCADFALTISDNLSDVYVDESLLCISVNAFITNDSCVNFKAVDGVLYNKSVTKLYKYPVDSKREFYALPSSATKISDVFAFVSVDVSYYLFTAEGIVVPGVDEIFKTPENLTLHIDYASEFTADHFTMTLFGPAHVCVGDITKADADELNANAEEIIAELEVVMDEMESELTPGTDEYDFLKAFILGYIDMITNYVDCENDHTRLHKYAEVVDKKEGDCTNDGYTNYKCVCGYEFTEVSTAPGHKYSHTETKVTCTTDGYTTHVCSVCNDTYTDNVITAEGHKYESVVTDPTCMTGGYTTHTCSVCGDSYVDDEVSATGHSHESKVTKEPTCTTTGIKTFTCHCGDSYTEIIKVNGHTKGEWEYIGGKEYAKNCTVCGDKLESKIVTVNMMINGENVNKTQILNKSTATVVATVTDNFANNLVFASSDDSIVSIDANGNIIANDVGKATVTVTISGTAISDSIEVEVLPRDFTITWNVNGKVTKQTIKEYASIIPNVDTKRPGYKFVGWDSEVPSTMPAKNLSFTAKFELSFKMSIRKPSTTTISYGDSIILHADMNEALPSGWTVKWTADNGNFSYSANSETCTITPSKSGDTTFTATVYDENGNEISKDTQTMKSKAGFFDKFAAFFRKLFGMTKIIQQSINF